MPPTEQTRTASKSRVMLVEDHPVVRLGLANLIDDEPDFAVCGGAESGDEAMKLIPKVNPEVVIVDISLGERSGLDLIKQIHDKWPDLPILALSMHDEALYAERALRAGAMGYIMKREAMDKVMTAIRHVLRGEMYVSEKMASRMVRKLVKPATASAGSELEGLSDREFEIFNLIAQSIGPSQIAQRLSLSVKTVETHREHIKTKLGLKNGAELTRYALQWVLDQR